MYFLSLLLLVLYSYTTDRPDRSNIGDTEGYKNDARASISELLDQEQHSDVQKNYLTHTDTHNALVTRRRKRATASFATAWNSLAKSTIGFARLEIHGSETKVFVKVGSVIDATNDFYSLEPITVTKSASGVLLGFVENRAIGLNAHDYPNKPMLYVYKGSNPVSSQTKVEKVIHYYENGWKARIAFGKWKIVSYRQHFSLL